MRSPFKTHSIIYTYGPINSDSRALISKKDPTVLTNIDTDYAVVHNLQSLFIHILSHRNIKLFLDYPFNFRNIIVIIFSYLVDLMYGRVSIHYFSVRGNLIKRASKNKTLKYLFYFFYGLPVFSDRLIFICSSTFERHSLSYIRFLRSSRMIVIPDIVFSHAYFTGSSSLANTFASYPKNKTQDLEEFKILLPARLSSEKGIVQVINLLYFRLKSLDTMNTTLLITSTESKFTTFITNLNSQPIYRKFLEINSNIKYLGWLDKPSLYQSILSCDVVLLPSLFESFSITAYETLLLNSNLLITSESPWPSIQKCCEQQLPLTCLDSSQLSNEAIFNNHLNSFHRTPQISSVSCKLLNDAILKEANHTPLLLNL